MTKEEVKQWLRNQIDFSVKNQSKYNNNGFHLYYNKNYLRALKLSKITGKPVNKENFKGGEPLFYFNSKTKQFSYYDTIQQYIDEHYSNDFLERLKIANEVINEYDEYKDYKY